MTGHRPLYRLELRLHGCIGHAGLGLEDAGRPLEPRVFHHVERLDRRIFHAKGLDALLYGRHHLGRDLERDVALRADDGVHRLAHDVYDHLLVADLDDAALKRLHHDAGHLRLDRFHEGNGLVDLVHLLHGDLYLAVAKPLLVAPLLLLLERRLRLFPDARGLLFGAADYFAVAVFALSIIASLSGKDMLNGLIAGLIGIMLSMVGMAPIDAVVRFTFGNYQLMSGFDITVLLIGVFAITDIILSGFDRDHLADKMEKKKYHLKGYGLSVKEFIEQIPNTIISSIIGIGIGILPGIGGSTSGLLAYTAARNRSKYPEKFGTGIIDGVIASECSNNATIGGSMIPLLCMGIPGNTVSAIFLGGLQVHAISPGPLIFNKSGQYVYGIYLALIISSVFMLIFERAGLPVFVKLLDIPKHILLPCIVVMCCVGGYSSNSRVFDVQCILFFGLLGLLFKVLKIPSTPLIIGFIVGSMFEENLRQALQAGHGSWTVFLSRPIAMAFLIITVISCAMTVRKNMQDKKAAAAAGKEFDTSEEDG